MLHLPTGLISHTAQPTCISSTMATMSAREISWPTIKFLSCRKFSSNSCSDVFSSSNVESILACGVVLPVITGIISCIRETRVVPRSHIRMAWAGSDSGQSTLHAGWFCMHARVIHKQIRLAASFCSPRLYEKKGR